MWPKRSTGSWINALPAHRAAAAARPAHLGRLAGGRLACAVRLQAAEASKSCPNRLPLGCRAVAGTRSRNQRSSSLCLGNVRRRSAACGGACGRAWGCDAMAMYARHAKTMHTCNVCRTPLERTRGGVMWFERGTGSRIRHRAVAGTRSRNQRSSSLRLGNVRRRSAACGGACGRVWGCDAVSMYARHA
jgi:hypothetical protein